MNGKIKFHPPTGPAFHEGEVWCASDKGRHSVTIVKVAKYRGAVTDHTSDYGVTYEWVENGKVVQHTKDAWNFQVRYTHRSDWFVR